MSYQSPEEIKAEEIASHITAGKPTYISDNTYAERSPHNLVYDVIYHQSETDYNEEIELMVTVDAELTVTLRLYDDRLAVLDGYIIKYPATTPTVDIATVCDALLQIVRPGYTS